MSLSFEDSLQTADSGNTMNNVNSEISSDNLSIALLSSGFDGWTAVTDNDKDYRFYNDEYSDENYSTVDELKNINLDSKQINITQEQNSQYIPFLMPRYYDGFDLTKAKLQNWWLGKFCIE